MPSPPPPPPTSAAPPPPSSATPPPAPSSAAPPPPTAGQQSAPASALPPTTTIVANSTAPAEALPRPDESSSVGDPAKPDTKELSLEAAIALFQVRQDAPLMCAQSGVTGSYSSNTFPCAVLTGIRSIL